jgi:hypothetical protein
MAADKLKPFRQFKSQMSASPTPLRNVHPKQKAALLRNIFNLARAKANLESWKNLAGEGLPEARRQRARFEGMEAHLARALQEVQQAKESLGELFDDLLPEDFDYDEIVARIGYGLQTAETWEGLCAASVHPGLRTPKEATIAIKTGEYEGKYKGVYPVKGVYPLDQWFIGESERLLDKFRTAKGAKLRPIDYDRIISRAFDAAFDEPYEESRVKTARRRIRRRPRLRFVRPFSYLPLPD